MLSHIQTQLKNIENNQLLSSQQISQARYYSEAFDHVVLAQGAHIIELGIQQEKQDIRLNVLWEDEQIVVKEGNTVLEWDVWPLAALYIALKRGDKNTTTEGKKYTRKGMKLRVWKEREERAQKEKYKIKFAANLYGEHQLLNEKGKLYRITLHDFDKKTGYINNIDWQTNKLGTTKHILYLYQYLETHPSIKRRLAKSFPFIDVFPDPENDYLITWYFPEELSAEEQALIDSYFGNEKHIQVQDLGKFFMFIQKANELERFKIRDEVYEAVENYFNQFELKQIEARTPLDFSPLKAELYPYQKEGVSFAVFKKGVIIADEMGLGKTLQAIGTAVLKKTIFDFKKTLVICPASVKHQWKKEIEKFTDERVQVIEGMPEDRHDSYKFDDSFFHIINYETVLRDLVYINQAQYDFVILDEAQKIKNYETKISNSVKKINKTHALVITGTPLENKLIDLYSIVNFLDPKYLSPQWEFSYQHCIFDLNQKNRILGYYNLQALKKRLAPILIRRQKQEVFEQLPNVIQKNVYLNLTDEQAAMHSGFMRGIAKILGKKFKTAYDMQKLMLLLNSARMSCDSSFLIDKESHHSSKMNELEDILFNKLELKKNKRKIIIFSEWVTMLDLIGNMLNKNGLKYALLTGKVPVSKRKDLIENFENDPDCQIFLSSESGGAGLNLQVADTVINFEQPWNPAKKNQRIGRINRIGQKKQNLLVYNLICNHSIEIDISLGLGLKQNLFDGVLNADSLTDEVDFTEKGKSQFIKKLEEAVEGILDEQEENIAEIEPENIEITEVASTENTEQSTDLQTTKPQSEKESTKQSAQDDFAEMEAVMNKGIEFLSGIYKMSTGKEMTTDGKPNVKVDRESGEVSISFKLR